MPEGPKTTGDNGGPITGRLTPDRVGDALEALRFAIREIERLGVEVPDHSRLAQHITLLESLDGAETYPDEPGQRSAIASALLDAAQFSLVASVLPEDGREALILDLGRSIKGSQVRASEESAEPYQFQSQLVFGALMVAAGHDVRVPTGQGMPDFVIPDGTLTHGVEVKRPTSRSKVSRVLRKAADQIAGTGGRGLVVLDGSDLLGTSGSEVVERDSGRDRFRARFEQEFRGLVDEVVGIIRQPDSTAPRPRFESVAALTVMGTGWLWITSEKVPGGWPESRAFFHGRRLYNVHDLTFHRGTMLLDMVEDAIRKSGSFEVTPTD